MYEFKLILPPQLGEYHLERLHVLQPHKDGPREELSLSGRASSLTRPQLILLRIPV